MPLAGKQNLVLNCGKARPAGKFECAREVAVRLRLERTRLLYAMEQRGRACRFAHGKQPVTDKAQGVRASGVKLHNT